MATKPQIGRAARGGNGNPRPTVARRLRPSAPVSRRSPRRRAATISVKSSAPMSSRNDIRRSKSTPLIRTTPARPAPFIAAGGRKGILPAEAPLPAILSHSRSVKPFCGPRSDRNEEALMYGEPKPPRTGRPRHSGPLGNRGGCTAAAADSRPRRQRRATEAAGDAPAPMGIRGDGLRRSRRRTDHRAGSPRSD